MAPDDPWDRIVNTLFVVDIVAMLIAFAWQPAGILAAVVWILVAILGLTWLVLGPIRKRLPD